MKTKYLSVNNWTEDKCYTILTQRPDLMLDFVSKGTNKEYKRKVLNKFLPYDFSIEFDWHVDLHGIINPDRIRTSNAHYLGSLLGVKFLNCDFTNKSTFDGIINNETRIRIAGYRQIPHLYNFMRFVGSKAIPVETGGIHVHVDMGQDFRLFRDGFVDKINQYAKDFELNHIGLGTNKIVACDRTADYNHVMSYHTDHNTIEFRWMPYTLDYSNLVQNIIYFQSLIRFVRNEYFKENPDFPKYMATPLNPDSFATTKRSKYWNGILKYD